MELKSLTDLYSLSSSWTSPELFQENTVIEGQTIQLCGLSVKHTSGLLITASAASLQESPLQRAYFELLERTSRVELDQMSQKKFPLFALDGSSASNSSNQVLEEIFKVSPCPSEWSYSKSNGVAAHTDPKLASLNAVSETIERDLILRSWYGELPPQKRGTRIVGLPEAWSKIYAFESYVLIDPIKHATKEGFAKVASVIVGFPISHNSAYYRYAFLRFDRISACLRGKPSKHRHNRM